MHRFVLKLFEFSRNILYFIKVLAVFFVMLHLLYWIEHLTNGNFGWLNFFRPILDSLLTFGGYYSKGSIDIAGAVFEYKYFIALLIYAAIFFIFNFLIIFLNGVEDKCDDMSRLVRKAQEASYNLSLKVQQEREEKTIKRYKVIVMTALKKEFSHPEFGYNIAEQNKLMNKFLIKNLETAPIEYEGGYVYSFGNFNTVDTVLHTLFEMIHSDSPLDYFIALQVVDENGEKACMKELTKLAGLKHGNKIITLANTVYRYSFNTGNRYNTSQLGLFQKEDGTLEVHQFVENSYI